LIISIDSLDKVLALPEAHREVSLLRFTLDRSVETTPTDQEALFGLERLHRPLQAAVDGHVDRRELRLHLHAQSRLIESECAASRENIDATVRAWRRDLRDPAIGFEYCIDELRQTVPRVPRLDVGDDLIVGELREICSGRGLILGRLRRVL